MLRAIRSNALGLVAVFIALGGVAFALQNNSVKSKHIKNRQVKAADLGARAVTGPKIKKGAVGPKQLSDRTRWIGVPVETVRIGGSAATFNLKGYAPAVQMFDAELVFDIPLPADWDGNSDLMLVIEWTRIDTAVGDVAWTVTHKALGTGDDFDDPLEQTVTSPVGGLRELVQTEIPIAKETVDESDSHIAVQVERSAGHPLDTATDSPVVQHLELRYESTG